MAKYKKYNYSQMVMIPVSLENQLIPGTLEYTIHEVIEKNVDLFIFNEKYINDETGAMTDRTKENMKATGAIVRRTDRTYLYYYLIFLYLV